MLIKHKDIPPLWEKHISTSIWNVQHTNTGRNTQQAFKTPIMAFKFYEMDPRMEILLKLFLFFERWKSSLNTIVLQNNSFVFFPNWDNLKMRQK